MAIKSPSELKKEAAPLIEAKEREAEQERKKRAEHTAAIQQEAEKHLAEIAKQIEDSVNDLVKLAISYKVNAVIIGKFDNNGNTMGRPDWIPNETERVFEEVRRKLPEGFTLTATDTIPAKTKEGKEQIISGTSRERGHHTVLNILMPAQLITTKNAVGQNRGSYMLLRWK